jgi:hypothetical protein
MNMTIAPTVLISRKSILNQIPTAAPFVGHLVAHNSLASGFLSMAALRNKAVSLRWALEQALSCGEKAGE